MSSQSSDPKTKVTENTNTITNQQNCISELKGEINELHSQTNSSDRLPLKVDKNK